MMTDNKHPSGEITPKRLRIARGIEAADKALMIIQVINQAYRHTRGSTSEPAEPLYTGVIPPYFVSVIEGSSFSNEGRISIPGLYQLLDIINDQIMLMIQAGDKQIASEVPDLIEKVSQLLTLNATLRDPDFITDNPDITHVIGDETRSGQTLAGLITGIRGTLVSIQETLTPSFAYGASCYHLEPADRFLIRSFMQGVNRVRADTQPDTYPRVIASRDHARLTIAYYDASSYPAFTIEIQNLTIMMTYTAPRMTVSRPGYGLIPGIDMVWKHELPVSDTSGCQKSTQLSGSFQARSPDEVLQMLSSIGYHISRTVPADAPGQKIAG